MEPQSFNHLEQTLDYTVHKWSSYSSNYHPKNIQFDKPSDQSSRWSSDSKHPSSQYIILKLQRPAILTSVTFGKYEKIHVCNLRKFTITGGVSETHQIHLLTSGLKNDNQKETFTLHHELQGKRFPSLYIKIIPVMSWGPSFNFSIWHITLTGVDEPRIVKPNLKCLEEYREQEAIRMCLKHFRQKNYTEVFEALQKRSKVALEDPILTELHTNLVKQGNFKRAEDIIQDSAPFFEEYVNTQAYKPHWTLLKSFDKDGVESDDCHPGMRGGHQMCIDVDQQLIFLLGGWDGTKDLADFWVYNIQAGEWHCISENTELDGGPSARSCHKMCFVSKPRCLYILGRFLDGKRMNVEMKSDFFKYGLDTGLWECISEDTYSEGGPHLLFDHQMAYDQITERIFVFGGRSLLTGITDIEPTFSGLYSYHVSHCTWIKIKDDCNCSPSNNQMLSRSGHSMLLDKSSRLLYIFAGHRGRNRESVNDFFTYNIDTEEIITRVDNKDLPSNEFTQRATIDINMGEIYVLFDSNREGEKKDEPVRNSFWVYNIKHKKWTCIYKNNNVNQLYWKKSKTVEPRPRFAYQIVYDPKNRVHFMFGGNPGGWSYLKVRLDDFWMLKLERSSCKDLLQHCKFIIRKLRFKELSEEDPMESLRYLQDEVSDVIDHNNPAERDIFEELASVLFAPAPSGSSDEESATDQPNTTSSQQYKSRTLVFNELTKYFPASMVQPTGEITDFVDIKF